MANAPAPRQWLDARGTSVLGFGVLRLAPPPDGRATFRVHYRDRPDGYTITDNAQLVVLPGDAFAEREMAFADQFLAFVRTAPPEPDTAYGDDAELVLAVDVTVDRETTVIVGYGPWTGPDTGRPSGDEHTFTLGVEPLTAGAAFAWAESEAGELITTNWTGRPNVARGGSIDDPISNEPIWIEVRPLILYDAALARAANEPTATTRPGSPDADALDAEASRAESAGELAAARDLRERADDLRAAALRHDIRIALTPELTKRFRRVPIRWR